MMSIIRNGAILMLAPIAWSLAALSATAQPASPQPPVAAPPLATALAGSTAGPTPIEQQIDQALAGRITLNFKQTPLAEVLEFLRTELKVPIFIDRRPINEAGVKLDAPVTLLSPEPLCARAGLDAILGELGLAWTVRHETLMITTQENCDQLLETRVYDVADLLPLPRPEPDADGRITEFDTLIDAILATVRPNTWTDTGGIGSITSLEAPGIAALVVAQTHAAHEQIGQLLADLRGVRHNAPPRSAKGLRARRIKKDKSSEPAQKAPHSPTSADADEAPLSDLQKLAIAALRPPEHWEFLPPEQESLRKALCRPISLRLGDAPLATAAQTLARQIGLPVMLDKPHLKEAQTEAARRVTVARDGITAAAALELVVEAFGLEWTVRDDTIQITTADAADENLLPRVYDVHDLTAYRDSENQVVQDAQPLMDVITETIEPESWDSKSGTGSIKAVQPRGRTALVVRQSWQVQQRIRKLLEDLRAKRKPVYRPSDLPRQPIAPEEPEDEQSVA